MVEVKADALEASFEAIEHQDDGVAALKEELEQLKAKIAAGVIAAQRPALDGVKSASSVSFVDVITVTVHFFPPACDLASPVRASCRCAPRAI